MGVSDSKVAKHLQPSPPRTYAIDSSQQGGLLRVRVLVIRFNLHAVTGICCVTASTDGQVETRTASSIDSNRRRTGERVCVCVLQIRTGVK